MSCSHSFQFDALSQGDVDAMCECCKANGIFLGVIKKISVVKTCSYPISTLRFGWLPVEEKFTKSYTTFSYVLVPSAEIQPWPAPLPTTPEVVKSTNFNEHPAFRDAKPDLQGWAALTRKAAIAHEEQKFFKLCAQVQRQLDARDRARRERLPVYNLSNLFASRVVNREDAPTLGTLDGMILHGPMTKGRYYRSGEARRVAVAAKIERCRERYLNKCKRRLDEALLHQRQKFVLTSNIRVKKGLQKPKPNRNCRNTSRKQKKCKVSSLQKTLDQLNNKQLYKCPGQGLFNSYKFSYSGRAQRNPELLQKLRNIIFSLKLQRISPTRRSFYIERQLINLLNKSAEIHESEVDKKEYFDEHFAKVDAFRDRIEKVYPQCDANEEVEVVTTSANTVMFEQRPASETAPITKMGKSWSQLSSMEPKYTNEELASRMTLHSTYEWTADMGENQEVFAIDIPKDVLKKFYNAPNLTAMRNHLYFRFNVKIKLVLTSNKFQMGALIAHFVYATSFDRNAHHKNIAVKGVERQHCILSAGCSNSGEMTINYQFPYCYLTANNRNDVDLDTLNIGRLVCMVLSPLKAASGKYRRCRVALHVGFTDLEYTGMVDRINAFPQMETAASLAGLALTDYLLQRAADGNRDNPPEPMVPHPMTPHQGGNMAVGTNLREPVNVLRIDGAGQTPHYNLARQELTTQEITSIFGYLTTFKWDMDNDAGVQLLKIPVTPLSTPSEYISYVINGDTFKSVPPLGVISCLYEYFHGDIQYKIQIICNSFYTGMLMVGYVPGKEMPNVSIDVIKNSRPLSFQLQEGTNVFTYTVPYEADRPFWPIHTDSFTDDAKDFCIGNLYVYVETPLALMDELPRSIECLVYIRGGENFQLVVPTVPKLTSSWYGRTSSISEYTPWADPNHCPCWVSNSRYFHSDAKGLLRYNSGDGNTNFTNTHTNGYYKISDDVKKYYRNDPSKDVWDTSNRSRIQYAVAVQAQSGEWWLAIVKTEFDAQQYVKTRDSKYLMDYVSDDSEGQHSDFQLTKAECDTWGWIEYKADAQMDARKDPGTVIPSDSTTKGAAFGHLLFGEKFYSLTDLCRRYQHYASFVVPKVDMTIPNAALASLVIRPIVSKEMSPRDPNLFVREGAISLIASGFAFIRGSIRMKIVCNQKITLWVCHRHDQTQNSHNSSVRIFDKKNSKRTTHNYCPGLASYIQDMGKNPVMSIEIPFYKDCIYMPTGFPKDFTPPSDRLRISNMGTLVFGIVGSSKLENDLQISVFYSIGDDFRFECFNGFPPMRFIQDLGNNSKVVSFQGFEVVQAQGENKSFEDYIVMMCQLTDLSFNEARRLCHTPDFEKFRIQLNKDDLKPEIIQELFDISRDAYAIRPKKEKKEEVKKEAYTVSKEEFDQIVGTPAATPDGGVISSIKNISDTATKVQEKVDKFSITIESLKKKVPEVLSSFINDQFFITIMSQVAHIAVNPNWRSGLVAVMSIFVAALQLSGEYMSKLVNLAVEFIGGLCSSEQKEGSATAQSEVDLKGTEFFSLLFTAVAGLVGYKYAPKGAFLATLCKGYRDIALFGRGFEFVGKLLELLFRTLKQIVNYIFVYKDGVPDIHGLLKGHGDDLTKWAIEVDRITDPSKFEKYLIQEGFGDIVYDRYMRGIIYQSQLAACSMSSGSNAYNLVKQLNDRLRVVRDDLAAMGKYPCVRVTPFHLFLYGKPGLGKSTMIMDIAIVLLEAIGMKCDTTPLYKHEPANDHWDNYQNQPIIFSDDFLAVRTPDALNALLQAFFGLCTNAPYTPPFAEIPNKKRRICPVAYIALANTQDVRMNEVNCPEAVYRRRHVLCEVVPVDVECDVVIDGVNTKQKIPFYDEEKHILKLDLIKSKLTEKQQEDKEYLRFEVHATNNASGAKVSLTWLEFKDHLTKMMRKHYERETELVRRTLEKMHSVMNMENILTQKPETLIVEHRSRVGQFVQDIIDKHEDLSKVLTPDYYKMFKEKADMPEQVNKPEALADMDVSALDETDRKEFEAMRPYLAALEKVYVEDWLSADGKPKTTKKTKCVPMSIVAKENMIKLVAQQTNAPVETIRGIVERNEKRIKENGDIEEDYQTYYKVIKSHVQVEDKDMKRIMDLVDKIRSRITLKEENVDKDCSHLKYGDWCECFVEETINNVPWLIPCCQSCETRGPINLLPCRKGCMLLCREKIMKTWWRCTTAKYHHERIHGITRSWIGRLFSGLVSFAKAAVKKTCSGILFMIKRIGKYLLKCIVPLLITLGGLTALSYWNKAYDGDSLRKRVSTVVHGVGNIYKNVGLDCLTTCKLYTCGSCGAQTAYDSSTKTGGVKTQAKDVTVKSKAQCEITDEEIEKKILEDFQKRQYVEGLVEILKKNTYFLVVGYIHPTTGQFDTIKCRGIFIQGRQFLTLKHGWDELMVRYKLFGNSKAKLFHPLTKLQTAIDLSELEHEVFEQSNYMIVHMPSKIPEHRNLVKHIAPRSQHDRLITQGLLVEIKDDCTVRPVDIKWQTKLLIDRTTYSSQVVLDGAYSYPYGGAGVCGSILIGQGVNKGIIGMHVAGYNDGTRGYSEPLCAEMFGFISAGVQDIFVPELLDVDLAKISLDAEVLNLGTVPAQFEHRESGQTGIVPSLVHGLFPVSTEPAPLHPSDPRLPEDSSPMKKGCEKHGMPIIGFPKELLDFGEDALWQEMSSKVKPVIKVAPLSLAKAVEGIPGHLGAPSLNFHSSEGWPWSAFRPSGFSDKRWMFDLELTSEGYRCHGINEKLVELMSWKDAMRKNGLKPFTVFVDCLKDARIPKEKCSIPGKTRIFSISPVDFTIQFRQYVLPYMIAHRAARSTYFTAVGINVHGFEWTELVWAMGSHSAYHACGDYKNFGAGFSADVHAIVAKIINKWFKFNGDVDPVNSRVREVLFSELINSNHLCFNLVYQVLCGMPSGSPITVETNDCVNYVYISMAWHEIMRDTKYNSYYYFCKFVKIKTYGDDLWLAIHELVIDVFNNVSISKFFAKYGVVYTDADKSGNIRPHCDLFEVQFLKNFIVPHPLRHDMFMAKLLTEPALDIANWCWKSNDLKAATLVNLEMCNNMLYGHGPQFHERVRQILIAAAAKLGLRGNFRTWRELDRLYLDDGIVRDLIPSQEEVV